jgi:hypothetical protein
MPIKNALSRMKNALVPLALTFLVILAVLQLFFRTKEGFILGDLRPLNAPCYADADCKSLKCTQGMCK